MRVSVVALALSCLCACPAYGQELPAPAPQKAAPAPTFTGDDLLVRAESAYHAIELAAAIELAGDAIRAGSLSRHELVLAYRLIGDSLAVQGKVEAARQAYLRLLAIDPRQTPNDELNPQMQVPFVEARRYWNREGPGLEVNVKVERQQTGPLLVCEIVDPLNLRDRLEVTLPGTSSSQSFEVSSLERVELSVPANATTVSYYVKLFDRSRNELYALGSIDSPRAVAVRPPPGPAPGQASPALLAPKSASPVVATAPTPEPENESSWLSSPWFWVGVGAVAVTGAVIAGVALRDDERDVTIGVRF